jgi:hypothetical protein
MADEKHLAIKRHLLPGLQFGKTGRRIRFRVHSCGFGGGHIAKICLREAMRSSGFAKENEVDLLFPKAKVVIACLHL